MNRLMVVLIAGALLAGACGKGPPRDFDDRIAAWVEADPGDYSFDYYRGGMAGSCTVRVTVRGGVVESVGTPEEEYCEYSIDDALTVTELFDQLRDEYDSADKVTVEYDEQYKFPTFVQVDRDKNAIDDEWGFGVRNFADES